MYDYVEHAEKQVNMFMQTPSVVKTELPVHPMFICLGIRSKNFSDWNDANTNSANKKTWLDGVWFNSQ